LLVLPDERREIRGGCCATGVLEAISGVAVRRGERVQIHKTCSIGWAPFPWLRDDVGLLSIETLIELADKAL